MNSNVHKDVRFIADFLLDLRLMSKSVRYQRGQFPGANYPLGLSPLCVCWVLSLKTVNVLSGQDFQGSLGLPSMWKLLTEQSASPSLSRFAWAVRETPLCSTSSIIGQEVALVCVSHAFRLVQPSGIITQGSASKSRNDEDSGDPRPH